jgi:predicted ArsR family transcriptional regulator
MAQGALDLTERQVEVLNIVVENKVFRKKDTLIPELSARLGIAPLAVYRHLLKIEQNALLTVVVQPSNRAKLVYERLKLEAPSRPNRRATTEALNPVKQDILAYLATHPDATVGEVAAELQLAERTVHDHLRVLHAIRFVVRERAPAVKRGVPPHLYRITPQGLAVLRRLHGDL